METNKRKRDSNVKTSYICTNLLGFCGSYYPNLAYARDGRIIRIRPYFHEGFSYKIKTRRGLFTRPASSLPAPYELAYKLRAYSLNRVKYPLKRIDFDPRGDRNPQNRGKSKFVRISWDEALEIIASEVKRIKEIYGSHAIAVMADGHGQSTWQTLHFYAHELFEHLGGCTHIIRNPDSWEGWYWGAKHVWGCEWWTRGLYYNDAIYDDVLENSDLLILTGADPETTSWGFAGQSGSIVMRWIKEAGIRVIAISPDANYTVVKWADKWIPIRPNTDAALYLAIAYIWIKEETYDKEYIKTHTHGFEEFKRYVLGEEDGVPKTPEWASKITGIPTRIIKALARAWASKRTSIGTVFGGPKIRGPYSTEPARLEAILLAMQGLGKPGIHQVRLLPMYTRGRIVHGIPTRMDLYVSTLPTQILKGIPFNSVIRWATDPVQPPFIPKTLLPDAILNPPISWYGTGALSAPKEDQFIKYTYPFEGYPEIRMIFNENSCWITCWNEGYKMIRALRSPKIEFIVTVHPWFENDSAFADIVLPAATVFETDDFATGGETGNICVYWIDKCIEPVGESKTDYKIMRLIAMKLGLYSYLEQFPEFEEFVRRKYEESICPKFMSWKEFREKKLLVLPSPSPEEWEEIKKLFNVKPGLRAFYENPTDNPLETPTGKLEFYSTKLAENFPGDEERPPVPRYIPYGETHQESLLHSRAKKYPLLMVSNHPRWRVHAQNDDIAWLREIPTCKIRGPDDYYYEPLWIHPSDAAKRGIKHGDIVKVYNERGAVLGAAYVTERIMPGVVSMDHGARVDLISIEDRIDRGGAINLICPSKTTSKSVPGMVVSGFLVEVEKANLEEIKRKYPEAFKREYNKASGLCYEME
ncbi:MAG: molybdopterin-dependent oxidoreductase [Candidatus Bathyarchaeia archaeon]